MWLPEKGVLGGRRLPSYKDPPATEGTMSHPDDPTAFE